MLLFFIHILAKINGGWSGWSKTGSCTKNCGSGYQKYIRYCNNPKPAYGGASCAGSSTKTEKCNTHHCPVHGGWSAWKTSGSCSKTCGTGSQKYVRSCTNPKPAHGGNKCSGSTSKTEKCNTHHCPVNGGWTAWTKSGSCSKSCGTGTQKYVRSCTSPKPAHGGKSCSGSTSKTENCLVKHCPVNGGWSGWSKHGGCSKSCGSGKQRYIRSCTKPKPAHGGKSCSGSTDQYLDCNTHLCASKYDINFGHKESNRKYLDVWSNAMYIWELHRPISASGTVRQWKFYARRTGTIYLQVSMEQNV